MLDQVQVSTAYRAIFRTEANEAQKNFYSNTFSTLSSSVNAMETAAVDTQRAVTFYQTYFDRLPDDAGLDFWTGVIRDNPTTFGDNPVGNQALALEFFNAGEFTTLYGSLTSEQVVSALYANVLGRTPDAPGLAFWIAAVQDDNGFGLQELGREFAISPETGRTFDPLIDAYLTTLGTGQALPGTDIFDFQQTVVVPSISLTPQQDNVVGTAGSDAINAVIDGIGTGTTLTANDVVDGGGGVDRLNILDTNFSFLPGFTISNVENFFIRTVGVPASYDFSAIVGEQQVWSDRSNAPLVDFRNLDTGTVIGLQGDGSTVLGAVRANYQTPSDSVSIAIDGGVKQAATGAAIDVNATTATSATIVSTGSANTVGGIGLGGAMTSVTIDAQSSLTLNDGNSALTSPVASVSQELFGFDAGAAGVTLTVTGAGRVGLGDLSRALDVVDASANTGGIVLVNANGTAVAPNAGTATVDITGSAGNDSLTNFIPLSSGSIDGGTGDDTLNVGIGVITKASDGAKYSNIEILESFGATIDLDWIAGIRSVVLNDTLVGTSGFVDLSVAQALEVTVKDIEDLATFGIKGANGAGRSSDELRLTFDDGDTTGSETITTVAADPTIRNVEKVSLVAVDDILIGSLKNTGASTPTSDVREFVVSGTGDASITAAGARFQSGTTVDASALEGTFTFDSSGTAIGNTLVITGGSNADILTGTDVAGSGDSIDGRAGDDVITGGAGRDLMTGGAGADTFVFTAGDSGFPHVTGLDVIADFQVGSDSIRYTGPPSLIIDQQNDNAAPTKAMIDSFGVATFNAQDNTLDLRIKAVSNALDNNLSGSVAGEVAVFENAGNSYVFISDGNGILNPGDVLVEVAGVTGLNASTIDATTGDLFLM